MLKGDDLVRCGFNLAKRFYYTGMHADLQCLLLLPSVIRLLLSRYFSSFPLEGVKIVLVCTSTIASPKECQFCCGF